MTYDSSVNLAAFTYWDNNTLLASSVNSIGRRPQGFTVTTASARKLVDVATPAGKASRYARFARKLHQYSSSMAEELASAGMDSSSQQQPRSVTGPFALIAPSPGAGQAQDASLEYYSKDGRPHSVPLGEVTLFLASPGVTSTAHFDSFANTHVLLRGRKMIKLQPPSRLHTDSATSHGRRRIQTPGSCADHPLAPIPLH